MNNATCGLKKMREEQLDDGDSDCWNISRSLADSWTLIRSELFKYFFKITHLPRK